MSYKEGRDRLDQAFNFQPPLSKETLSFTHLQHLYSQMVLMLGVIVQDSGVNDVSFFDKKKLKNRISFNNSSIRINFQFIFKEWKLLKGDIIKSKGNYFKNALQSGAK